MTREIVIYQTWTWEIYSHIILLSLWPDFQKLEILMIVVLEFIVLFILHFIVLYIMLKF